MAQGQGQGGLDQAARVEEQSVHPAQILKVEPTGGADRLEAGSRERGQLGKMLRLFLFNLKIHLLSLEREKGREKH